MTTPVFLTRVVLRNYKSIGACDVRLGPLPPCPFCCGGWPRYANACRPATNTPATILKLLYI